MTDTTKIIRQAVKGVTPYDTERRRSQVQRALEGFTFETPSAEVHKDCPTYRKFREIAANARKER